MMLAVATALVLTLSAAAPTAPLDTAVAIAPADDTTKSDDKAKGKDKAKDTKSREKGADKALKTGSKIHSFEAKDMDGKSIDFPSDFKGKVVLLDFWATWCGPCMAEMPNVASVYETYREQGFEVIAVSLDQDNAEQKIRDAAEAKGMKWRHIYQGGGWNTPLAKKFAIRSIPRAFLVDGSTGVILAEGDALRGERLGTAVKDALAKKGSSKDKSADKSADKSSDKSSDKSGEKSKEKSKDKSNDSSKDKSNDSSKSKSKD